MCTLPPIIPMEVENGGLEMETKAIFQASIFHFHDYDDYGRKGISTMFLVHHWSEMFELVRLPPQPQRTTPCLRPRRSNRSRASCRALRSSCINKAQGSLSKMHQESHKSWFRIWRYLEDSIKSSRLWSCIYLFDTQHTISHRYLSNSININIHCILLNSTHCHGFVHESKLT